MSNKTKIKFKDFFSQSYEFINEELEKRVDFFHPLLASIFTLVFSSASILTFFCLILNFSFFWFLLFLYILILWFRIFIILMDEPKSPYLNFKLYKRGKTDSLLTEVWRENKLFLEKLLNKIKRKYKIKVEKNIYSFIGSQAYTLWFLGYRSSWGLINRKHKHFIALSNLLLMKYSKESLVSVLCHELWHTQLSTNDFYLNLIEALLGTYIKNIFNRWIELRCDIYSFNMVTDLFWKEYALKWKKDFFLANKENKHIKFLCKIKRTHPLDETRAFVENIELNHCFKLFL